ncbi:hypothetical protein KC338_g12 [Hortaea werneckii]|nr:hypothetical protein KC338_g12 [Hortaea werneckii]
MNDPHWSPHQPHPPTHLHPPLFSPEPQNPSTSAPPPPSSQPALHTTRLPRSTTMSRLFHNRLQRPLFNPNLTLTPSTTDKGSRDPCAPPPSSPQPPPQSRGKRFGAGKSRSGGGCAGGRRNSGNRRKWLGLGWESCCWGRRRWWVESVGFPFPWGRSRGYGD